tara:strand:+ start:1885 stop:2424 length:540 start_codon:yes stop_codon:yes gene_type:complete
MITELHQAYTDKVEALNIKPSARRLLVSIEKQTLSLIENNQTLIKYMVSTGLKPPSNIDGSGGTPLGLHQIRNKIGDGAVMGEVFKGRVRIDKRYHDLDPAEQKLNLITTRILWLEGLEPGFNKGEDCDSYSRFIYIHGTNHENRIGRPASGGCIQLSNIDMLTLYNSVEDGDHVFIYE